MGRDSKVDGQWGPQSGGALISICLLRHCDILIGSNYEGKTKTVGPYGSWKIADECNGGIAKRQTKLLAWQAAGVNQQQAS